MTITALSGFEPFSVEDAKGTYHTSYDTAEKARSAEKIYRYYLSQGHTRYNYAVRWFVRAFENQSPEALFIAYTVTDPQQYHHTSHDKRSITPYLQQKLKEMGHTQSPEERASYLVQAAGQKHPIACQMSSYAIARSATETENTPLLDALEDNGFDITYDQMLELHAIALIQGERILTNSYSQLIEKNNPDDAHDQRRLGILETIGLEVDAPLSWDLRFLSALNAGRDASAICFKGLVKGNPETIAAAERIGLTDSDPVKCSLGYHLRHQKKDKEADYQEVLRYFQAEEIFEKKYSKEQMWYIRDHAIEILQHRVDPVTCNNLLAPDIFRHKLV